MQIGSAALFPCGVSAEHTIRNRAVIHDEQAPAPVVILVIVIILSKPIADGEAAQGTAVLHIDSTHGIKTKSVVGVLPQYHSPMPLDHRRLRAIHRMHDYIPRDAHPVPCRVPRSYGIARGIDSIRYNHRAAIGNFIHRGLNGFFRGGPASAVAGVVRAGIVHIKRAGIYAEGGGNRVGGLHIREGIACGGRDR